MNNKVTIKERGWPAHGIISDRCLFHRNTLLTRDDGTSLVVSTIGAWYNRRENKFHTIGCDRFYETRAFVGIFRDGYIEANTQENVCILSPWQVATHSLISDSQANDQHDLVVSELTLRLEQGELFDYEGPVI